MVHLGFTIRIFAEYNTVISPTMHENGEVLHIVSGEEDKYYFPHDEARNMFERLKQLSEVDEHFV